MRKTPRMRFVASSIIMILVAIGALLAAQVILANSVASRDFGPRVCWLKQGSDTVNLRQLEFATTGYFIANPLTLLNRRLLGIGMEDPAVLSPHFAILAPNAEGTLNTWGWSIRERAFWRDDNGTIDKFVSTDLRDNCKIILDSMELKP